MTVGTLKKHLADVPDDLEIVVRCDWDGDQPNGNCFNLNGVCVQDSHATEELFAALDCDQDL